MATHDWRTGLDLTAAVAAAPERYAALQLLRLVESLTATQGSLGLEVDPTDEVLRFHGSFEPSFAPGAVVASWLGAALGLDAAAAAEAGSPGLSERRKAG